MQVKQKAIIYTSNVCGKHEVRLLFRDLRRLSGATLRSHLWTSTLEPAATFVACPSSNLRQEDKHSKGQAQTKILCKETR